VTGSRGSGAVVIDFPKEDVRYVHGCKDRRLRHQISGTPEGIRQTKVNSFSPVFLN
jgi:hypothetical protein